MKLLKRKLRKNFTLLELLIIVAILAIVGGGLVTSFEGLQAQAAKASATNTIASLQNSIRTYQTMEGSLPNNLDSLLAAVPNDASAAAANGVVTAPIDSYVGPEDNADLKNFLGSSKMGKKVKAEVLTATQVNNLIAAGITKVRFIDSASLAELAVGEDSHTLVIPDADNETTYTGAIADIDIPQLAFNAPRPGATDTSPRNRGRGFEYTLLDQSGEANGSTQQFAVWGGQNPSSPQADYDNTKLGADPKAVLVAFGIGPDSTIVDGKKDLDAGHDTSLGEAGKLGSAPYYGDVAKSTYNSYVMLVDVEQNPAKFVCVVDARGDFLAEEFAEQSGQKL
jgi:type II secretory pathway pseudopilin PulG